MEKFSNNEVLEHSQFRGIKSCSWQPSSSELFLRREWVTGCKTSDCAKTWAVLFIETWMYTFLIRDCLVVWPFFEETVLYLSTPSLLKMFHSVSEVALDHQLNYLRTLAGSSFQFDNNLTILFFFLSEKPTQSPHNKTNLPKTLQSLPVANKNPPNNNSNKTHPMRQNSPTDLTLQRF